MIDQLSVVDERGDIILHGRQGAEIILEFQDAAGALRDMSAASVTFEVGPSINIPLTPVAGVAHQMKLTITNANVKSIEAASNKQFIILDNSTPQPTPVWQGMVYITGWTE